MKKTFVIAEELRVKIAKFLLAEESHRQTIETLSQSALKAKMNAWEIIYKACPEARKGRSDLNCQAWTITYEIEEYTREGENVIEEVTNLDKMPISHDIHPIFDEVHTPPPLEKGK